MIELIASDMDGTLLNNDMKISTENAAAVKLAQKQGVHFLVATGRSHTEAQPVLSEVGIKCPMITVNGAQAFDKEGQELFTFALDKNQTKQIIETLTKAELYFEIATTHGVYSIGEKERKENAVQLLLNHYDNYTEESARAFAPEHLEQLPVNFIANYNDLLDNTNIKILKFIVFSYNNPGQFIQAQEEISNQRDISVTSSFVGNFEVNHIDAQKGKAVTRYAQSLNIPLEKIMTLGDNLNDLSMLAITPHSFAMANAATKTKEIAQYETDTNVDHGVAKAILKMCK
ncbi:HAD family phosphatase [Vagococcus coleopterorum]|uniref:HAD family phosphatase n=1 Tax=Vagococcus coleopterorum TaxID=2714946 RepID=A0A6G8AM31_9ENTE|nr:Cof-type HAD-IIB family hydrolase [Vagococcus coleopterorum]QIL46030.1 HAD family phosphatase [Vagococcus coleopterorum]